MRLLIFILLFATTSFSQMPAIEPGVSQELAKWRAARYSDVRYKLNLTLEKMSPVLKGTIEIRVKVSEPGSIATGFLTPIILDWRRIKGFESHSQISNFSINERKAVGLETNSYVLAGDESELTYLDEREHLVIRDGVKMGENVIKLDFTSPILTSGSAITRYIDKEDGSEYIYSLFVPSDASTAFPVFDQPDLKAKFKLSTKTPRWKVVSNERTILDRPGDAFYKLNIPQNGVDEWRPWIHVFEETKPISTYVFAFAAGPFEEFTDAGGVGGNLSGSEGAPRGAPSNSRTLPTGRVSASASGDVPSHIYVRKSQAEKFKPHAAEVFRLNREGIKYLETYFDYKFPWPKYDLVLIPEFPFGGMEHAGATFLREQSVIFPQEPTKNDVISRANLIFHEAAHQWFGDTVTMKWFDDLWLKEGFATFMAYKALDKIMPEANAWKVFYERVKQAAYQTDSTRGTTAIYQPIANLSAAKSAYGNIVYNKAPAFLRQAEFYLGEDKFQTAVRAFLKKHEFGNAGWEDLVKEFDLASGPKPNLGEQDLTQWAEGWVKSRDLIIVRTSLDWRPQSRRTQRTFQVSRTTGEIWEGNRFPLAFLSLAQFVDKSRELRPMVLTAHTGTQTGFLKGNSKARFFFPNYQDYGYGIFLLDDKSRDYVLKNIQNEKDDFLRTMMWGSLWDSVREGELDPKEYVELVIKNIGLEKDEGTIQTLLNRVATALNYYLPPAPDLRSRLENLLINKIETASTQGQRITYYRAFLNIATTGKARAVLKEILNAATVSGKLDSLAGSPRSDTPLRTKDKFDIVTRLAILGDPDAAKLLADLEKTETSDDAKRYAYAARAAFATVENKAKFWNDFVNNKDISEGWIEAAFVPFNSIRHSGLTLPYLERALTELPTLKRGRKIFFVNNWLAAFISGQRDEKALGIINKFLADNPNLDNDLRLKILENADVIERAVKIRSKYTNGPR